MKYTEEDIGKRIVMLSCKRSNHTSANCYVDDNTCGVVIDVDEGDLLVKWDNTLHKCFVLRGDIVRMAYNSKSVVEILNDKI